MIITPVIVEDIKTLKDGSLKLNITTQELTDDECFEIVKLRNKQVYVGLKDTEIKPDELDIKEMPTEFKTDKSPSQRLRSVLFVYWQNNRPTKEFNDFYERKMNEFIEVVKSKLN